MINIQISPIYTKGPLLGLLLLFSFALNGQSARFMKPLKESLRNYQVLESEAKYYSVGQTFDKSINRYGIILVKMDSIGNPLTTRKFIDSNGIIYPSNHISLIQTFEDNFLTVASKINPSTRQELLIKFDTSLSIVSEWVIFSDSIDRAFYQVKQLPDSGYVITGYWYDQPQNMYHANLVRTDKNGQLLWERVIKRNDSISLWPYQVYPAPDGGFLLAGQQVYLADFQTADPLLIRTDSVGNVLWRKTYGGSQIDGVAAAAYRDDGDIMLFYSQGTHPIQQGHSLIPVFSTVDDQTGQELQKKTYPFVDFRDLQSHNLLKDGKKFIGIGKFTQESSILTGGGTQSFTINVDQNLNDQWLQFYNAQGTLARPDEWSVLYDLRPTADGGYISGGYILVFDTTNLNVNLGFNGWIVKMDSMGCVEMSCINRIANDEPTLTEVENTLSIYPNPSRGIVYIEYPGKPNGTIALYDLKGRKVEETKLIEGTGILNKHDDLPPGMYFIKVLDELGVDYGLKVIITE